MNKFASTRINQIQQLQALEGIVVGLQRKYASELIAYDNMTKTAGLKELLAGGKAIGSKGLNWLKNKGGRYINDVKAKPMQHALMAGGAAGGAIVVDDLLKALKANRNNNNANDMLGRNGIPGNRR